MAEDELIMSFSSRPTTELKGWVVIVESRGLHNINDIAATEESAWNNICGKEDRNEFRRNGWNPVRVKVTLMQDGKG